MAAAHRLGVADKRPILKRLKEVPFSSDTKCMEISYQMDPFMSIFPSKSSSGNNNSNGNNDEVRYLKGALEVILPMCVNCVGNVSGELVPLTAAAIERVQQHSLEMASEGLRVLAVASGTGSGAGSGLTLCGVVGLMDPLRENVVDAVRRIIDSGAKVMMITGDAEATALSIAKLAGIYSGVGGEDRLTYILLSISLRVNILLFCLFSLCNLFKSNLIFLSVIVIFSSKFICLLLGGKRALLSGKEIEELVRSGEDSLANVIEDVVIIKHSESICFMMNFSYHFFLFQTV